MQILQRSSRLPFISIFNKYAGYVFFINNHTQTKSKHKGNSKEIYNRNMTPTHLEGKMGNALGGCCLGNLLSCSCSRHSPQCGRCGGATGPPAVDLSAAADS